MVNESDSSLTIVQAHLLWKSAGMWICTIISKGISWAITLCVSVYVFSVCACACVWRKRWDGEDFTLQFFSIWKQKFVGVSYTRQYNNLIALGVKLNFPSSYAWVNWFKPSLSLQQEEGETNCHLLSCGTARCIHVSSGITNLSRRMFTKGFSAVSTFPQKDKRFLALWLYLSWELWCQFLDIS